MKKLIKFTAFSLSLAFLNCSYLVQNAQGQIQIKPNVEINTPTVDDLGIPNSPEDDSGNIDDLPNNPQQMFSWRCSKDNKTIAVEVKDVDNWQKLLDTQNWSCKEDLSIIPGNKGKFSCTPSADVGILTVVWLQGEGGKEQMQTWFDDLNKDQNMVCYQTRTNKFWS